MTGWILSQVLPYIIGALAIFGGLWGYGRKKKREGRDEVVTEIERADREEAAGIKEKINALSGSGDALERLRKAGRLRD